jgi:ABC-type molybdenum transport system ATPase subunit/photorepair protein PhrA
MKRYKKVKKTMKQVILDWAEFRLREESLDQSNREFVMAVRNLVHENELLLLEIHKLKGELKCGERSSRH